MSAPTFHCKKTKHVDLKTRQVVYYLKIFSSMENDPGDDAALELFSDYIIHLRRLRAAKKVEKKP